MNNSSPLRTTLTTGSAPCGCPATSWGWRCWPPASRCEWIRIVRPGGARPCAQRKPTSSKQRTCACTGVHCLDPWHLAAHACTASAAPAAAQVEGEAAVFQLRVGLNCSHQAPVPHFDSASFTANVTLAPEGDAVVRGPCWAARDGPPCLMRCAWSAGAHAPPNLKGPLLACAAVPAGHLRRRH